MKSTRVIFLLLSLLQFIFFLKLVEYVRGEEVPARPNIKWRTPSPKIASTNPEVDGDNRGDEGQRGLFIAPRIQRKKLKPWTSPNQTETETKAEEKNGNQEKENVVEGEEPEGRLCPACENNECAVTVPIFAGFPIVPFVIAVLVAIGWFILFLIFWLFWIKPKEESEGYGYGDGGGYGAPTDSYGPPHDDKPGFPSFLKPHERSFNSYTQMLSFVLDSIGKFTDLYNTP